jgi:hypothetical protein
LTAHAHANDGAAVSSGGFDQITVRVDLHCVTVKDGSAETNGDGDLTNRTSVGFAVKRVDRL